MAKIKATLNDVYVNGINQSEKATDNYHSTLQFPIVLKSFTVFYLMFWFWG